MLAEGGEMDRGGHLLAPAQLPDSSAEYRRHDIS